MPTLAINAARALEKEKTGVGWYSWNLLEKFKKIIPENWRVILYTIPGWEDAGFLPANWSVKAIKSPLNRLWSQFALANEMRKRKDYTFFIPGHVMPYSVRSGKNVVTVHDVAALKVKDAYNIFEKWYSVSSARHAYLFASNIIVPSESVKNDMVRFFGGEGQSLLNKKIKVVHHGVDSDVFHPGEKEDLKKYGIKNQYIYFVGRLEEKKNTKFLIKAFGKLKEKLKGSEWEGVELVLAGPFGLGGRSVKKELKKSEYKNSVKLLGYVGADAAPVLMRNAAVFAFPSREEGFGLPVLEAMASGVPAVLSDIAALKEVAGDAALFSGADDMDNFVKNLESALRDSKIRNILTLRGRARSKEFTWEKCAVQTWQIIENCDTI